MPSQLEILDSIMGFQTQMMGKIWDLIGIHYQLYSNDAILLTHMSDGYVFLDLDLDKV